MSQPQWKLVAQLGDVNPIDYGGLFVYIDETNTYSPEMERLEMVTEPDTDDDGNEIDGVWETRRVVLDRCTFIDGVLSDNPFHPSHAAWFADSISDVASYVGMTVEELISDFCSTDPVRLAYAYRAIGDFHGWGNLDSYPNEWSSREELETRYSL